ncbi:MAG: cysteine synthase A [bacterium]
MRPPLQTIADGICNTPLVEINKVVPDIDGQLYGKLESNNPGGSVKDRIAMNMVKEAEESGELEPGMTIIEPTSGNTGIGLALIGAVLDYDVVVTLPEGTSTERKALLESYGATVHSTPLEEGMRGAIDLAEELIDSNDGYYMLGQFENSANPDIHRRTTGPEIYEDLDGELDAFVTGVGTGGTITGVGEYLKDQDSSIEIVAVEPSNSPVLSGGKPGQHIIQGIGAGFIPKVLNVDILDEVVTVQDQRAIDMMEDLGATEGLLVGVSAGANVYGAVEYLKQNPGSTVVTTLCDTGERYLSGVQ